MRRSNKRMLAKFMVSAILLLFVSVVYAAEQPEGDTDQTAAPNSQMDNMANPAKASMAKEPVTVAGTIMAIKNKAGKISSYSLKEDGGQSLYLSKHGQGMALRKMVGKKVEATGTLTEAKGKKWITVTEFKEIQ
jgi:lysyl-tRNA synthetase class II